MNFATSVVVGAFNEHFTRLEYVLLSGGDGDAK